MTLCLDPSRQRRVAQESTRFDVRAADHSKRHQVAQKGK